MKPLASLGGAQSRELTRQGELTVHALTRYAGVSQPAVSKHLTVLKRAKLVRHRRE